MSTSNDPMQISIDGTPFSVLMDRAVKLKTAQEAGDKKDFKSRPKFVQDTIFHAYGPRKDEVVCSRSNNKSMAEKLHFADILRVEGNVHFKNERYNEAYECYSMAAGIFRYLENNNPKWKDEGVKDIHVEEINLTKNNHLFCSHETKSAKQFVSTCYQNIALTAYRMKDFCLSIDACNEILSLEPLNVKALYRRAKATIAPKSAGTSKYLEALSDLKMALRLEPSSIEVRRKYKQIKDLVRDQKAKDKATFQGFFERSRKAIYDYTRQGDVSVHGLEHESLDTILKHAESLFHKIKNDPNKKNDTLRLKEWIEQAHSRLSAREEKDAPQLNFKNPSQYEVDKASQFGIDLRDDRIIEMLEYLQSERKRTSTDRTNQCIENSKLMELPISFALPLQDDRYNNYQFPRAAVDFVAFKFLTQKMKNLSK